MAQSLVLHVSSDAGLLKSRGELLRQHWNVVDALPHEAIDAFATHDFDAVVICGSVDVRTRRKLVDFFSMESPSLQIIAVGSTFDSDPRVLSVPHFDPTTLHATMTSVLETSSELLKHPPQLARPKDPAQRARR